MRRSHVKRIFPKRGALPSCVSSGSHGATVPACRFVGHQVRQLANVRDDSITGNAYFSGSFLRASADPHPIPPADHKPPDERTLKLGKTVRILHERLPTLLNHPLPQDILSPQIKLCLFPTTHPHLPTVSGRIGYSAALWTAPVAWGRVPVVGNVRLEILSERMIKAGGYASTKDELVVKWRTCGKTKGRGMGAFYKGIGGNGDQVDKITEFLGGDARDDEEFTGLFFFNFDEEGRIVRHLIEHAQHGGSCDKMTRVVSVTDWLIGLAKGKQGQEPGLALGYCENEQRYQQVPRRVRGDYDRRN